MKKIIVLSLLSLAVYNLSIAAANYSLTSLGIESANDISNAGVVVGGHFGNAVIYNNGSIQILRAGESVATNENGLVVIQDGTSAYVYQPGSGTYGLPPLIGNMAWAKAVNESNQVIGYSRNSIGSASVYWYDDPVHGWVRDSNSFFPNSNSALAQDINDNGLYVGGISFGAGSIAFKSNIGTSTYNNLFPDGTAYAVNNSGYAVGQNSSGIAYSYIPSVVPSIGTPVNLGTLGGASSQANDINETNQIVGTAQNTEGASRAFLYNEGSIYDLNDAVINITGWTLLEATAINDSGYIIGIGINNEGDSEAFLLTPIPEHGQLSLLISLVALAVITTRRKV